MKANKVLCWDYQKWLILSWAAPQLVLDQNQMRASLKATRQYRTFNCDILVWSHSNSYMLQSYGHTWKWTIASRPQLL